jgi:hypothetical protein
MKPCSFGVEDFKLKKINIHMPALRTGLPATVRSRKPFEDKDS